MPNPSDLVTFIQSRFLDPRWNFPYKRIELGSPIKPKNNMFYFLKNRPEIPSRILLVVFTRLAMDVDDLVLVLPGCVDWTVRPITCLLLERAQRGAATCSWNFFLMWKIFFGARALAKRGCVGE